MMQFNIIKPGKSASIAVACPIAAEKSVAVTVTVLAGCNWKYDESNL